MILTAIVSDLHVGSTVGLLTGPVELDDGGTYHPTREQDWLAECWSDFWDWVDTEKRAANARLVTVVNGDVGDMNSHSAFQLFSVNPAIILDAAAAALEEPCVVSDVVHIVRGTEAHSGGSAWLECKLAQEIGAPPAWWHLEMELEGVRFDCAHHPSTNSRIYEH